MTFLTASICKPGGRKANEDACDFALSDKAACWVVADGLGGHRGGAAASQVAVEQIVASFRAHPALSPEAIKAHLESAQQGLIQRQEVDTNLSRMRTTVVLLLTDGESVQWGHAGDSRLYHFRDGRVRFQTEDHSVSQVMVVAGNITPDQLRHHEDRNRLLRTLGGTEDFRPEVEPELFPLQHGDAFLLCTDGFWEHVLETEMEVELAKANHPQEWLEKMEAKLLERATGEYDNYSAIAVFVEREAETEPPAISTPPPDPTPPKKHKRRWFWRR